MNKKSVFSRYLLFNPLIKGWIEWMLLAACGLCCVMTNFGIMPMFPVIQIAGGAVIILSFLFHFACEITHKQAHRDSKNITKIVTTGIYSVIRHPIYLSLILINIGIALAFGSWVVLILAALLSISPVAAIFKEEEYLLANFPREYGVYMKQTRWRLLPGIF
jgi:protein-S-isoprenylcysteine O-methyltransferase Ste14